jgi:elongation factor Ts
VEIKASDVKALREKTGAGMVDCKKALTEANGDFARAEKILKELGLAAVAKRSERATNQGRAFTLITKDRAGVLELSCETDFVARNTEFIAVGKDILAEAVKANAEKATDVMEGKVKDLIAKIKENMAIRRIVLMPVANDEIAAEYVHGEGAIGVIVKMKADKPEVLSNEKVKSLLFDFALHVAAFNPMFLAKEVVPADYIKEQEGIFNKQVAGMDKPQNVLQGIVKGKLNKLFTEICLLDQPFVKDDKKSANQVLNELGKEVGAKLTISGYLFCKVGEEL